MTTDAYRPRDNAIDSAKCTARRALQTARYWREEATAPIGQSLSLRPECRGLARARAAAALEDAARFRRLLEVEKSYRAVAWVGPFGPVFGSVAS